MTQKTSKKLSATPIPSTEKYLYGVYVIVNKKLSPTFDAVKLTPSTHNTDQDMYDGATTTVRSAAGLTEEFKLGVGLHQGSALSSFLFAIIIDRLTEDIRKDTPRDMLFADDIVLFRQNYRELEEDLEIWKNALERRGLKVSRSKTEYLRVGAVDDGEELKLQGEKVKRAKNFKYLGSTVSNDGRCKEKVRRRIQSGWMSWRKVSGVLCDRKLSAKVKGKM